MAGSPDQIGPLAAIRRLLRDLRNPLRPSTSPIVALLLPRAPVEQRQATVANIVRIALYRLPRRQRELLKRYDLEGESAANVQRGLGLSPRQFFRDRRAALSLLSFHLLGPRVESVLVVASPDQVAARRGRSSRHERGAAAASVPQTLQRLTSGLVAVGETELLPRTLARSLSQLDNINCLRVLTELALQVQEPARRADLLLDLADEASEYDDDATAHDALRAVALIVHDEREIGLESSDYLSGRMARAEGRLADTRADAASHYSRATALLRRAFHDAPRRVNSALSDTLGDIALLNFGHGAFAEARMASFEARRIIEAFELWSQPRAVEIIAMDQVLEACLSGKVGSAINAVSSLLGRAMQSGWFSTAHKLGAHLVGLNAVVGDYNEAIRWYERLSSSPRDGARPRDRIHLTLEAAHAYTMSGRPGDALSILGYVKPGYGCPSAESPTWHAFASAALERSGDGLAALAEARQALEGYATQQIGRGAGEAHRNIATAQARLGNQRSATEHILEAQRLSEIHGTPWAVLRTLVAKANILGSAPLKKEAIELSRLLLKLGKDNDEPVG